MRHAIRAFSVDTWALSHAISNREKKEARHYFRFFINICLQGSCSGPHDVYQIPKRQPKSRQIFPFVPATCRQAGVNGKDDYRVGFFNPFPVLEGKQFLDCFFLWIRLDQAGHEQCPSSHS